MAGVSEAAVSYAISGKKPISTSTRDRILAAMAELDYRPNAMARGLAGGKSMIIALLFPTRERGISNADLEYVLGAANAARELGYHLLLWPTEDRDVEEVRSLHQAGLIDGVLLMEVRMTDERVEFLSNAGVPVGLIGRTRTIDPATVFADRDFDAVTDLAVEHLAGLGHTHIAFVDGPQGIVDSEFGAVIRAEAGFLNAIESRRLIGRVLHAESTVAAGRRILVENLAVLPEVTALVCMNAEATIGILAAARDAGRAVPESLSIVSIATPTNLVAATSPELTTISPPAEQIGRVAARLLIDRLGGLGLPPESGLWMGELVVRGTSGPPPQRSL